MALDNYNLIILHIYIYILLVASIVVFAELVSDTVARRALQLYSPSCDCLSGLKVRASVNVEPFVYVTSFTPSISTPGPDQSAVKLPGTPSVTVTVQVMV